MTTLATVVLAILGLAALIALSLLAFTGWTAWRVERSLPPRGTFLEVDGTRLHYLDEGSGSGRDILLIHGLGGQVLNFRHSLMGKLAANHRVVAIDRPGCGYSGLKAGGSARLAEQVATIAAAIETLGLRRPLVVGHSLGGAVALALALDHPEKVGGLALVAPLTQPRDEVPEIFAPLAIRSSARRRLIAWTLAVPSSIRNARRTLSIVFGPDDMPPDFGTKGGGLLSLRPRSFIAASSNMTDVPAFLPAFHARYGELEMPVGILFGTGDRILDWRENGRAMADRIDGLHFETIEGAGHMIPVTRADRSAAFIETMAARLGARAGQTAKRAFGDET